MISRLGNNYHKNIFFCSKNIQQTLQNIQALGRNKSSCNKKGALFFLLRCNKAYISFSVFPDSRNTNLYLYIFVSSFAPIDVKVIFSYIYNLFSWSRENKCYTNFGVPNNLSILHTKA